MTEPSGMNENQFERVKRALKDMVNETIDGYFSEVQAGLAAHAAIAAMEWGWQPIESAPRDGTFVDLWYPGNGDSASPPRRIANCRWSEAAWWAQIGGRAWRMDGPFTH